MNDLFKILRGLLSISVPQHFANVMKEIVSSSFELFSAVREKGECSGMEDDEPETGWLTLFFSMCKLYFAHARVHTHTHTHT